MPYRRARNCLVARPGLHGVNRSPGCIVRCFPHPPVRQPLDTSTQNPTVGTALALSAFTLWGLFPLYFVAVDHVEPTEVLAHRIIGSAVLLLMVILVLRRVAGLRAELSSLRRLGFYLLTSLLVTTNWLIYIHATQNGHVIDASLGYFINPLVTVVLAMVFLGERLTRRQGIAVGIAAVGVAVSVLSLGEFPWIALSLAATFGTYGLLRKKAGVDPTLGLLAETLVVTPMALAWLVLLAAEGRMSFLTTDTGTDLLLLLAGVVTVLPLFLWLSSMRHLRLSTVGLLQYITPTLQFLLGLWMGESLRPVELVTFLFIWTALVIYTRDNLTSRKH